MEGAKASFFMAKTRLFIGVLIGIIAAFYVARGEKLTATLGGITAFMSAISINEWGVIVGMVSVPISLGLQFYFKKKDSDAFQKALEGGLSPEMALKAKDSSL